MSIRILFATVLGAIAILAVGCGGTNTDLEDGGATSAADDAEDTIEAATDTEAAADSGAADDSGAVDATEQSAADTGGSSDGWCAALPTDEVQALFDEQLELGEPRTVESGGCIWPVVGAEGEGLMVTATTAGTFEALAGYEEGGGVETERLELGDEALLLNGADLVIRREGGELRLALQALFFSEEMGGEGAVAPDPEVTRQGLIDLAELALERTN
jgi:hypothetical protein